MSKLDELIRELCPDGVELKKIKDVFLRLKGTPITAAKMKEIEDSNGEIRVFAGGKTVINANDVGAIDLNLPRVETAFKFITGDEAIQIMAREFDMGWISWYPVGSDPSNRKARIGFMEHQSQQLLIENSYEVLSIYYIALIQGIDNISVQKKMASQTKTVYEKLRALVPVFVEDTPKYKDIERIKTYLMSNQIAL